MVHTDFVPALIIHWKYPSKAFEKFSLIRNFRKVSRRSTLVLSLLNSLSHGVKKTTRLVNTKVNDIDGLIGYIIAICSHTQQAICVIKITLDQA